MKIKEIEKRKGILIAKKTYEEFINSSQLKIQWCWTVLMHPRHTRTDLRNMPIRSNARKKISTTVAWLPKKW